MQLYNKASSTMSLARLRNITSSSTLRNIGSSSSICESTDQFYRYKRSSVEVTYRNTGKGQTVIDNIKKISHELETQPENLIRYLKKQFNATFDKDGVIHAKVDKEKIETEIDKYIDLYVLCPRCKLPEYHAGYCSACGYASQNSSRTSLCERNEKTKSLKFKDKDKMIKDIHDCMNGIKKEKTEVITPEMEAEKKLGNSMDSLYKLRDSTKDKNLINQIDFILDCMWAMPDINELVSEGGKVTSSRYIGNIEKMVDFVNKWKQGNERLKQVIDVLTKISKLKETEEYQSEELDKLKDDSTLKTFKCLFSKHLKDQRVTNTWYSRICKMKIEKIADEAEAEFQKKGKK